MPYKLSGVLKSPNGQPLTGVDIQFIAQQTQSPVLQQTDHNIRLGLDGAYNVTLENNTYAVKAQINGLGPQHMGYILISSDTPVGLDLPQLLRSYSQQSTAPDYAQLIEKWLSEAKAAADTSTAQAASAKSQADRAKSEADRASQITGLDTVADAIGLAAVPFPDVWIPLNDSLRMFAGYGREVKVGDDVVARVVNFERSTTKTYRDKSGVLRTAAINEPAFEKEGLLIEGQSTNLFLNSETGVTQTISTQAGKYTLSFFGVGTVTISGSGVATLVGGGAASRVSVTVDCSVGNALLTVSGAISKVQFEALPFASSYIPTNGAAVTRAADKWFIPNKLNCGGINEPMSLSLAFTCLGYLVYNNIFSAGDRQLMIYAGDNRLRLEQGGGKVAYITSNGVSFGAGAGNLLSISTGAQGITTILNGVVFKSGEYIPITGNGLDYFGSSSPRPLFGHIKNLRIWHHALSDAQIKGLK